MAAGVDVKLEARAEFHALKKRLDAAGNGVAMKKELRAAIVKETKPVVEHLREAVLAIDSKVEGRSGAAESLRAQHAGSRKIESRRSHGLRATIARSIAAKVRTAGSANSAGVTIRVDTALLPKGQRNLPRALDSAKGWRHPTWGHAPWVHQTGAPWWSKTIESHRDNVRQAILSAMRAVADTIRE